MSWQQRGRFANRASKTAEAKVVDHAAVLLCRGGVQAVAHQLAGTQQHQAVDQLGLALAGSAEVAADERALASIVQVVGDSGRVTGGNGDQRIERSTPCIQRVWDQVDFLDRHLRLVKHGLSLRLQLVRSASCPERQQCRGLGRNGLLRSR